MTSELVLMAIVVVASAVAVALGAIEVRGWKEEQGWFAGGLTSKTLKSGGAKAVASAVSVVIMAIIIIVFALIFSSP